MLQRRTVVLVVSLMIVMCCSCFAASYPPGMDCIFKGIEPGKPYHAFWPPLSGQDLIGTIVIAKDPAKIQAIFEAINAPEYRNIGFSGTHKIERQIAQIPNCTGTRTIGVDIAFSQLDAVSSGIKNQDGSQSAVGQNNTATQNNNSAQNNSSQSNSTQNNSTQNNSTQNNSTQNNSTAQSGGGSASATGKGITGVDFSVFTDAKVTIPTVTITYYALTAISSLKQKQDGALSTLGLTTLSDAERGWIIARCLSAPSISYQLTSNTDIDAGFLARMRFWLPTVKVSYVNKRTVSLTTSSPVVFGYKLWRPTSRTEGAGVHPIEYKSADQIDDILDGK